MPYLKERVNSNYEEISRVMVARAVGFLVGALGGGVLCDRLPQYTDLWYVHHVVPFGYLSTHAGIPYAVAHCQACFDLQGNGFCL